MITHNTLSIQINGKAMPACISLQLSQPVHGHHFFRAEFAGKAMEQDPLSLAQDSLKLSGSEMKLEISNTKGEALLFKGVVTSVRSQGSNQASFSQNVVLEGYSPTILLENGPACQAFTKLSLSDIVAKASQGAAQNLLKLAIKPMHSATLPYTVQYGESAFAFINRLACRWGEWCYYDGLELVFGEKKQPTAQLFYGYNLLQLDVALQTAPLHGAFAAYSYKGNEQLQGATKKSDSTIGGTAAFGLQQSEKTWQPPQAQLAHQFCEEEALQQQLDALARLQIKAAAARQVQLRGQSANPSLFPGAVVEIKSAGGGHDYGSYIITQVDHQFLHGGHYSNSFEAVPLDVEVSPQTQPRLLPQAGQQAGLVADNKDPEGLGRVQVKLFWHKDTTTPWIRMATPHGGSDKGLYFVPEIGEQVMVGFEEGNAEKPFVLGSLYHGKAKAESFKNDKNDIKAIRTRSGHTIELNDADGKEMITISDKGGSIIQFDTKEKSLYISAPENLEISAKNIKISAEENIEIGAKKQIDIAAQKDLNLLADGALALQAMKDATMKSKSGSIQVEATKDAIVTGMNVMAEGKVKADLSGTQTTVAGKITMVQGAAGKTQWI